MFPKRYIEANGDVVEKPRNGVPSRVSPIHMALEFLTVPRMELDLYEVKESLNIKNDDESDPVYACEYTAALAQLITEETLQWQNTAIEFIKTVHEFQSNDDSNEADLTTPQTPTDTNKMKEKLHPKLKKRMNETEGENRQNETSNFETELVNYTRINPIHWCRGFLYFFV